MDHPSDTVAGASLHGTTGDTLWHSGRLGKFVARAEALLRRQLRQWRLATADRRFRKRKHFDLDPHSKRRLERPSWIPIARGYLQTIVDEATTELLVTHPQGPFEAVGEFRTFVDDCFCHLYDDYFRVHMLTWKFEIFEDFECTKPIPITNDDRYTEFRHLVLNGNPPLSERIEDAITNYLEAVGQASKLNSPVHAGAGAEPKPAESICDGSRTVSAQPAPLPDRRAAIDKFLLNCKQETSLKATRTQIWRAAGHSAARQFQFWQASDPKATAQDNQNFRRILAMTPTAFEALLKNKGII
jgi:hypothetical protein